ncbi:MAG: PHB depolymerase family esterase [Burkholderiales bacterium]
MANALTRLWLGGMNRLVKAQRRQTVRAVQTLLGPPKKSKRRAPNKPGQLERYLSPLSLLATRKLPTPKPAPPKAAPSRVAANAPAASPKPVRVVVRSRTARNAPITPSSSLAKGRFTRHLFKPTAESTTSRKHALHYWLYWPSKAPATPRPLVVMLHGCGQTALEFAQGTRMNELAERKGFAVLYPQQSVTSESSRCWPWYLADVQAGEGDAALLNELVRAVLTQQRIDRRRVYVAGISAGAAMAQILALTQPGLIAAIGMHSGPVFGAASSKASGFATMQQGAALHATRAVDRVKRANGGSSVLPALLIHGDHDKVVRPVNLMQAARQMLAVNGMDLSSPALLREHPARVRGAQPTLGLRTLSYTAPGDIKPRVIAAQVNGLEHAWSGGASGLRHNSGIGPDASALLWNFFARQRRAAA